MSRLSILSRTLALLLVLVLGTAQISVRAQSATPMAEAEATPVATTAATGLANPRGFTWGADGTMFVGLAGSGGDTHGSADASPFYGGLNGGGACVRDGTVTRLASALPSSVWREIDWVWGVNDVEILGDHLYALVGGGGAVHGNPDHPSGVYRIAAAGTEEGGGVSGPGG